MTSMLDRRRFLGIAGASVIGLAACGGPDVGDNAQPENGAQTSGPDFTNVSPAKKITFWSTHPGSSEAVTRQLLDAFTAESGIEVDLVTAGQNYEEIAQRFQTAQASGELPDAVVLSDVWWFRYYMQRTIIPLDKAIEAAQIDLSDYRQSLVADYQYGGSQWALPWARSTPLFYYNKDHWKQAGLEDRAPKTWDEFAEWGPKLMGATKVAAYEFPALDDYAGWTLQNPLWGWGGGWSKADSFDITCDAPESVAALQWAQDAVYKDKWAAVASKAATDDLAAGGCSATISSTGSLVGLLETVGDKFEVGAGFLPGGPETESPVCPTGGAGLGVPADRPVENQLAAVQMIGFLTKPDSQVTFSEATGYMPVRTSADVSKLAADNPLITIAIDQLDKTRPQDWARVFIPGADQEMAKAAAAILNEQKPVPDTMTALKATLEQMYETQVKPNLG